MEYQLQISQTKRVVQRLSSKVPCNVSKSPASLLGILVSNLGGGFLRPKNKIEVGLFCLHCDMFSSKVLDPTLP